MPGQEQQSGQPEEEVELKDVVSQTLESRGVLSKIRAQIRAAVFLALEDEAQNRDKLPTINRELKTASATREGALVMALIYDFLRAYELDFTQSVFAPETGSSPLDCEQNRSSLRRQFGLPSQIDDDHPVLLEVVKHLVRAGQSQQAASTLASSSPLRGETVLLDAQSASPSRNSKASDVQSSVSAASSPAKSSASAKSAGEVTGAKGVEPASTSLSTLKDAPPLFASSSNTRNTAPAASTASPSKKDDDFAFKTSPSKKDAEKTPEKEKVEAEETEKPKKLFLDIKKLDDADGDDNTDYKDDFDESVRSESLGPNVTSPQRGLGNPAPALSRKEVTLDEDAEEVDDEVIEIGEDEQSRSSDGNLRIRDKDRDDNSLNDPTINSDRSLGLDYVEDVVSQH